MRNIIVSMFLMLSFLNAGIFDKVYIFTEKRQNNKDENEIEAKVLIEKRINFQENSFLQIDIAKVLKYDLSSKESDFKAREIKDLYYNTSRYNEVLNLKVGIIRQSFDYGKTYSMINYLSPNNLIKDSKNRSLKIKPMDGFSLSLIKPNDGNDIKNTATMHIYAKNIFDEKKQKEQSHLIELKQEGDKFHRAIFIANQTNKTPSISIAEAQTQIMGNSFSRIIVLKYEHNEKDFINRFSSLINLEYSIKKDSFIGIEYFYLSDGLKDKKERTKKHHSFKNYEDFKDFYKNLTSKQYLSLYLQLKHNNFTSYLSTLENLKENSRKINLQGTYDIGNTSLHSSIEVYNSKENDTEFGFLRDNFFEFEYKLFVSYLWEN